MSENTDRLADWFAETPESITARLEGAKASQGQIRWALGTMAVISMMMLIAAYNAYLSYDYGWILKVTDRHLAEAKAREHRINEAAKEGPERKLAVEKEELDRQLAVEKGVSGVLTEQALRDWAASRIIHISILGIRVSVDDAAVLGTAVLFVLSLWLLLVARRENRTIGSLLQNTNENPPDEDQAPTATRSTAGHRKMFPIEERWRIFHTIISNSLFLTLDPSLSSVHSLKKPLDLMSRIGLKPTPSDGPRLF